MRWMPVLFLLGISGLSGLIVLINQHKITHRYLAAFGWLYLTGLAIILFTSISYDGTSISIMPSGTGRVNLRNFYLHGLQFWENIILTVPLGILLKKMVPQMPLLVIAILGVIFGGAVESFQYFMSNHWLINRSSDINDVIANAAGIIIGSLAVIVYQFYQEKNHLKQDN